MISSKIKRATFPSTNPYLNGLPTKKRLQTIERLNEAKPNANQTSLLLSLPPELRNRIYELGFSDVEPINISACTARGVRTIYQINDMGTIKEPGLLRTCRTLRTEATAMYYTNHTFFCTIPDTLFNWLKVIGKEKTNLLTDVRGGRFTYRELGITRRVEELAQTLENFDWYMKHFAERDLVLGPGVFRAYLPWHLYARECNHAKTRDEILAAQGARR